MVASLVVYVVVVLAVNDDLQPSEFQKKHTGSIRDGALLLTVLLGLVSVVGLSRWLDSHRAGRSEARRRAPYLNATTAKRMSLGFNGLAADWYWLRSLQYIGGKHCGSQ